MSNYITIDGGTTNTRLYPVRDGRVLDTVRLPYGSNPKHRDALKDAVREAIGELIVKYGMPDAILGCGMLTSEFGLCEVKHLVAPAGIREFHRGIVKVSMPELAPVDFYFVPGIKVVGDSPFDTNMMRGEETELFGLVDALDPTCAYILPGSHSKIVTVDADGRINGLRSFMTGEMNVALSQYTVLAGDVDLREQTDAEYLLKGFEMTETNGINEALLKVRTLLKQYGITPSQAYSFYTGCIMHAEVKQIAALKEENIVFGGRRELKEAETILLQSVCTKKIIPLDDVASKNASTKGMIKIFEYAED